ncbi:MAG: bifunctional riboflavin kinase/FAD synthetase [Candidatus Hydrogenedentes bacterium]|nr:bifunctional riboflavin kinase/FAD synthetase [Candidatus Hydrogenedentota bacterium]
MRIIENLWDWQGSFPGLVLTVGSFDGVHLGHRRILSMVTESARKMGGTSGLMTFRPHPREFFAPASPPNLLTPDAKKFALIDESGVDVLFVLPFEARVANMDRREFVTEIVHGRCKAVQVVVGHDFRFGREALGDYHYLKRMGPHLEFDAIQAPPLYIEGERVSSTAIRESLLQGDLDKARLFLGRPYSIVGEVIQGRGVGHELGFPTANIAPYHTAVPAQGVYAAQVKFGNQTLPAAVNIGIAPTIRQEVMLIEAHVLGFSGDLRGRRIEVVFHKRLRPERRFATRLELAAAIGEDVAAVRNWFLGGAAPEEAPIE